MQRILCTTRLCNISVIKDECRLIYEGKEWTASKAKIHKRILRLNRRPLSKIASFLVRTMAHRTPFVLILIMSCYITFAGDRISQSATLFLNPIDGFLQKRKINRQLFPKFIEVSSCRLAGSFLLLICHQLKKVCGGEENKDFRYASDVLLFWFDLRTRRKSFTETHHSNVFSGAFVNKK